MDFKVYDTGTAVNFGNVTHAWITDQPIEVQLYFVGGTEATYLGELAEQIWKDFKSLSQSGGGNALCL